MLFVRYMHSWVVVHGSWRTTDTGQTPALEASGGCLCCLLVVRSQRGLATFCVVPFLDGNYGLTDLRTFGCLPVDKGLVTYRFVLVNRHKPVWINCFILKYRWGWLCPLFSNVSLLNSLVKYSLESLDRPRIRLALIGLSRTPHWYVLLQLLRLHNLKTLVLLHHLINNVDSWISKAAHSSASLSLIVFSLVSYHVPWVEVDTRVVQCHVLHGGLLGHDQRRVQHGCRFYWLEVWNYGYLNCQLVHFNFYI